MKTLKVENEYRLVGSDFSQQEPRLLSFYSGDENMINAYKNGKDLYSMIASRVYHNNYEDNLEHNPDGSIYEDGKKRRSSVKSLLLGIMYGISIRGIAESLKCDVEEAQSIQDSFFEQFPAVKTWTQETVENAKKVGYVEDWRGRRRRFPVFLEPDVKVFRKQEYIDKINNSPLLENHYNKEEDKLLNVYYEKAKNIKWRKDQDKIKKEAEAKDIEVWYQSGKKADASRQCVNARIQGGAATMTKVAMVKLFNDKELNDLDFHMLIGVHDELIGECPAENQDKVAERLTYIMRTSIADICSVPFKCDAAISHHWYQEEYESEVTKEFKELCNKESKEEAWNEIKEKHSEFREEELRALLLGGTNV